MLHFFSICGLSSPSRILMSFILIVVEFSAACLKKKSDSACRGFLLLFYRKLRELAKLQAQESSFKLLPVKTHVITCFDSCAHVCCT